MKQNRPRSCTFLKIRVKLVINGLHGNIFLYINHWIARDPCFPGGSVVKNLPTIADGRDVGLIPVSGRAPGEGNGNPLQDTCLENSRDRLARWAIVHGVTKRQTDLATKQQQQHRNRLHFII